MRVVDVSASGLQRVLKAYQTEIVDMVYLHNMKYCSFCQRV